MREESIKTKLLTINLNLPFLPKKNSVTCDLFVVFFTKMLMFCLQVRLKEGVNYFFLADILPFFIDDFPYKFCLLWRKKVPFEKFMNCSEGEGS